MESRKPPSAPFTVRVALIAFLMPYVAALAWARAGTAGGNPSPRPGRVIILGKVLDFKATHLGENGSYVYEVEVTCEFRGLIKPGSEVRIEGPRQMEKSELIQIPLMAKGSNFVMAVEPTRDEQLFRYNSRYGVKDWLPIGTQVPAPVASVDVADMAAALLRYGELYDKKKTLTHKDADALRTSENYFIWALGTTAIADTAIPQDARLFEAELNVGVAEKVDLKPEIRNEPGAPASSLVISLRQALWLVHCLSEVIPPGSRPTCDEIRASLSRYLGRFVNLAEQNSFVR